jgi:acyl transferase domain-containing protein/acyl carrier protein
VAIIGMGCRWPGGVTDLDSFRRLLVGGRDAVAEIPADRINLAHYFDPRPATPGRMMTRWGGYLESIRDFDAAFFGISPREAERLDPQQRLLLETAWEAIEDAGLDAATLAGSRTGVFVGQWTSDFEGRLFVDPEDIDFQMTTGSGRYAASGRISYFLGLRGPSLTIDTACSSSLAAVHLAARSIQTGDATLALAGGVNLILQPHISIAYSQSLMMAPDGRCKFGDAAADGYVRSEGVGVVLLKPLEQALADGDRIHAVIRGGALNNDGRGSGSMGTPSRIGQEELLSAAYGAAGVSPASVGYVEAHGTGTRVGDPVELGAINTVLGAGRPAGRALLVGSVKTNIGHTEGAAGVAGLMKAALAVRSGRIPASLHRKTPNPDIAWGPCSIPTAQTGWPDIPGPRRAGVSAFGIAGANAHVVLEEPPAIEALPEAPARTASLLPLSAKSPEALRALAGRYADLLADEAGPSLPAVAWNAAVRRTALDQRAAFVAADREAMVRTLRDYSSGGPAPAEGTAGSASPKVAFVFPGQGGQWLGMARQLMAEESAFRETLERCDAAARPYIDWSIVGQLKAAQQSDEFLLDRIDVIQPVLVAVSIAYAEWLRAGGVTPHAVVGHSMGEIGAAYVAGVIDLDAAMRIICRRSALMGRVAGKGAMALVDLGWAETEARLARHKDGVVVAVSNSLRSSVISGEPAAVQAVLDELTAEGIFCRLVKVDVASHSPQMAPLAAELVAELDGLAPRAGVLPVYSTMLGREAKGAEFDASYWGANLRRPVQFAEAVKRLIADGVSVFVECGPHPVLVHAVQQMAMATSAENVVTISTGDRNQPEYAALLQAVGGLWAHGAVIDWAPVSTPARHVSLPLYPWQRERHWVDIAELAQGAGHQRRADRGSRSAKLDGARPTQQHLYVVGWAEAPVAVSPSPRQWLLLADRGGVAQALAGLMAKEGTPCRIVLPDAVAGSLAGAGVLDLRSLDAPGLTDGVYDLLQFVRTASALATIWAVTRRARAVESTERAGIDIASAAIWGLGAALATEHGDVWGGCIDLDPAASVATAAQALFDHLRTGQKGDVALRGKRRLQPRLRPMLEKSAIAMSFGLRADASYLVTGGLGAVGLRMARWMVEQGARRLVIFGRTPLPDRRLWKTSAAPAVAAVRSLEAMGASVVYAAIDVADAAVVATWLADYEAQNWPPIRGAIHAAGVSDERLTKEMDLAATAAVLSGKAQGALNLDRLLPDLDIFVLVSSMAVVAPSPGQSVYAAANAALDALALQRQGRGQPALSVGWGPWIGLGMMGGEQGIARFRQLQSQGITGLEADAATGLLTQLIGGAEPHIVVLPADWAAFQSAHPGRDLALFSELLPASVDMDRAHAALTDPAMRRQRLEEGIREAVSRVLKLPVARIDARKALGDLGLTSLLAMELRNKLEALVERPLPATLAFNYPTLETLVGFLAGEAGPPAPNKPRPAPAAAPADLGALAGLSDEDAAQLLRRR